MKMTNTDFKILEPVEDIRNIIKDAFELDLNIQGGWGYDNSTATVVNDLENMNLEQFVHTFATIRAILEMNLTLDEDKRYGGINASFEESKKFEINSKSYDVLTFKITAMNEKIYAKFIQEYKDKYGKEDFDLEKHFKQREENTISRYVDYWFLGLKED